MVVVLVLLLKVTSLVYANGILAISSPTTLQAHVSNQHWLTPLNIIWLHSFAKHDPAYRGNKYTVHQTWHNETSSATHSLPTLLFMQCSQLLASCSSIGQFTYSFNHCDNAGGQVMFDMYAMPHRGPQWQQPSQFRLMLPQSVCSQCNAGSPVKSTREVPYTASIEPAMMEELLNWARMTPSGYAMVWTCTKPWFCSNHWIKMQLNWTTNMLEAVCTSPQRAQNQASHWFMFDEVLCACCQHWNAWHEIWSHACDAAPASACMTDTANA